MMQAVKDISSACRGCISEVALQQQRDDPLVRDMFAYCTNIQVTDDEILPGHFCKCCHDLIATCYQFLRQVRRVDATLRSLLPRSQPSVIVQRDSPTLLHCMQSQSQYIEDRTEYYESSSMIDTDHGRPDESVKELIYLESTNCVMEELPSPMEQLNSVDQIFTKKEKETTNFMLYYEIDPGKQSTMENTGVKFREPITFEIKSMGSEKELEKCNLLMEDKVSSIYKLRNNLENFSNIHQQDVAKKIIDTVMDHNTVKKVEYIEQKNSALKDRTRAQTKDKVKAKAAAAVGVNKCPFCQRFFITKTWLQKHISTHSKGSFICKYCSKDFLHQYLLKQHEVTHSSSRPFACSQCPKRYKLRKQLNFHVRSHQQRLPLYQCHHCSVRFKSKSVLINHLKCMHEMGKTSLCHLCGAAFSQSGNLKVHMRIHTGAKPHRCRRCAFHCSSASSLRRHERRHEGARPHACNTCSKTFHDASGLSRHVRTHTGELPYRCELCGQAFIDSWKRKSHIMKQHHVPFHDVSRARKFASA